jgi:hypothetical protein
VAADLGLVPNTAQRHADELAAGRAGDGLPDRGLARSGRPYEGQDGARAAVVRQPAVRAQLPYGQILGDPPLHVVEAGVVGIQHRARVPRVQAVLRALRPGDGEQPVEVGPDHRRLGVALAHALETAQLALGLLLHRLRHACLGQLLPVLLGHRALVFAQLLADRVHLPPQEILALLLLGPGLDLLADALADAQLGEALLLEPQGQAQALDHVQGLQQLHLLLEVQIGRVPGGVRQRSRVGDGADEGADAAVVAPQLEDLLDHRAVLALQLAGEGGRRDRVRALVHRHAQHAVRPRLGGARHPAVEGHEGGHPAAAEGHPLRHLGHHADLGVAAALPGDEQHAALRRGTQREGDLHPGEGHDIVQCDQPELGHDCTVRPYT